jgi:hypothetical protein
MDLTETLLAATEQWLQKTAPNRVATSSVTADDLRHCASACEPSDVEMQRTVNLGYPSKTGYRAAAPSMASTRSACASSVAFTMMATANREIAFSMVTRRLSTHRLEATTA